MSSHLVKSFPFLMIAGICVHVACSDGVSDDGGTTVVGPVGSQGTGFNPACNDNRRDGYCNALGGDPETCECFDCVESAMCTGKCIDDGMCMGEEDCSCQDCYSAGCVEMTTTQDATTDATTDTVATTTNSTTGNTTTSSTTANTTASTTGSGMGGAGGS